MAKNVNIHIKTPGAEQASEKLKKVGDSAKKVGEQASRSGAKGAGATDRLKDSAGKASSTFSKFAKSILSWSASLFGIAAIIGAITKAVRIQSEALKEHGQIAEEQQRKLSSLQYLGEFFKERPELREEVATYAEYGRRPFEDVAQAWYNLRSKGAGLTREQKDGILRESLELGRTSPDTPLDTLVDMFSLYAKRTGQTDMNRVQNVLLQTITEAGGSAGDVAKYMPQFLPIGMSGGLSGSQSAGLWSYVTTQLADASIATTGLRATFMGLQGRGTPESQKLLSQLGVSPDMDFFQKISAIASRQKAGQFSLGQAELLAGREGAPVLLSLLQNPGVMMQTIGSVTSADTPQRDMTANMITALMGGDEVAALEDQIARDKVRIANLKGGDVNALRWLAHKKTIEANMRKQGISETQIRMTLWGEGMKGVLGYEPGEFEQDFKGGLITSSGGPPMQPTPTVINNNNITNYNPRTGSDGRGPRADRDIR